MGKRHDLTGQTFGQLLVKKLDEEKSKEKKRSYWIVECTCNNYTVFSVAGTNLLSGRIIRCPECRTENLSGKRFGKITVIDRDYNYAKEHNLKTTNAYWHCKCDCGTLFSTQGKNLREGLTKSCGCIQKEYASKLNYKDITGQTFGFWTVTGQSKRKDNDGCYYWYCDCKCGTKHVEISGKLLRKGVSQSCGCMRSHGEEKIANILSENHINFQREYIFKDFKLSTGGTPRFDFAILDDNNKLLYLIEYQGEQHYKFKGNIFTEEKMLYTQKCDKEKEEYCNNNHIPIICIPYTKYNTLTINDLLLVAE